MSRTVERVHLSGIEICRAVAAFAVVIWHYQHFFQTGIWSGTEAASRHAYPFYDLLFPFYGSGYAAVEIFWTISGVIFYWKYSSEIHQRTISLGTFSLYRISRLYPLHLVTFFIVAFLQFLYCRENPTPFIYQADWRLFFPHLLMASNWLPNQPDSFNGPVWSVSIEVLAYMAFFVVARSFRPGLVQCVIGVILAKCVVDFGDATFGWPGMTVVHCLQYFFSGGVIHFLIVKKNEKQRLLMFGFFGCLALALIAARLRGMIGLNSHVIWAASFVIVGTFHSIPERFIPLRSVITAAGNLTYSSYMVHFPIQLAMVLFVQSAMLSHDVFYDRIAFLLYISATFGLAYASFRFFETPAQRAMRSRAAQLSWWPRKDGAKVNS
jgi:peptidoglycan/LPS O-acetylase OafA/YrhL